MQTKAGPPAKLNKDKDKLIQDRLLTFDELTAIIDSLRDEDGIIRNMIVVGNIIFNTAPKHFTKKQKLVYSRLMGGRNVEFDKMVDCIFKNNIFKGDFDKKL